ncbi:hypothetical protein GW17_00046589 [Ensete ventricosum]|nr:hypothetical protein GW17_00046589 [Ensete ventricosum]RZR84582.1 hypothetical protein BHM03_00011435 [Ensete ventricosum]
MPTRHGRYRTRPSRCLYDDGLGFTPSKVLHLRNLPWECTEEELIELCKPFGKIVNTKCNVGANRNQAFVEFVSVGAQFPDV